MRQLSSLDAQFLNVESSTTVGHVGSLIVVDPETVPGGEFTMERVRAVLEPRLHLAPPLRQRLVPVPFSLGLPYWADDPDFDIEFHLRELALPSPGTLHQLGEQVSRIHARPLDRTRPLWEMYVIHGVEDGKAAVYSKVHHAAIDGVSGAEILATLMDVTREARVEPPEEEPFEPTSLPSPLSLVQRGLVETALHPLEMARTLPRSLPYLASLPGATNYPGAALVSEVAESLGRLLGGMTPVPDRRRLYAPRTPFNGSITAHRRFAFGSVPLADVKQVKSHFDMTVNDVVMTLTATALRRWLLDHDALPAVPLVAAVPVSVRDGESGGHGNHVSVMAAELPTHLADPRERLEFMTASMRAAKQSFDAVPATILNDLVSAIPTALSGLAAKAAFRVSLAPGVPMNLIVSNVPGPQMPLYVAGAQVEGVYPVSAISKLTGGLNVTLFSYDGNLDFGLIACREMVPDVWNIIGYLQDALAEMVALVPSDGRKAARKPGSGSKARPAKRTRTDGSR